MDTLLKKTANLKNPCTRAVIIHMQTRHIILTFIYNKKNMLKHVHTRMRFPQVHDFEESIVHCHVYGVH